MSGPSSIDVVLGLVADAQQRLEVTAAGLTDADLRVPSELEGWTRGHVLTHLARNADSQVGLLAAAARGEVADQYPGGDAQRSGDIEAGAGRPAAEQQADLAAGHTRFLAAAAQLHGDEWERPTRTRLGELPAWVVVWARWREVEVHHTDLGAAPPAGRARLDDEFVVRFLPPELERVPRRLDPGAPGRPTLAWQGEPAERLLWLLGRPAPSVTLTADGRPVAPGDLTPWVDTAWIPGRP